MHYTLEELEKMMENNNGDLDLSGTEITSLPEGLMVKGYLDISNTPITSLPEGLVIEGSLYGWYTDISSLPTDLYVGKSIYLAYTQLTSLPDNLVVNGELDLNNTLLTTLPNGLVVKNDLEIANTPLISLPNGLVVGGSLYGCNTNITTLPNDLIVGKSLRLDDTLLTSLPDNLSVNGILDLENTPLTTLPKRLVVKEHLNINNTPIQSLPKDLVIGRSIFLKHSLVTSLPTGVKADYVSSHYDKLTNPNDYTKWQQGDYKENEYLFADGILTLIKRTRQIGPYTFYQGRFKDDHVITDGTYYAHCKTLKAGIRDLAFKQAEHRGVEVYEQLSMNDEVSVDKAITMYRVITGACQAGVAQFVISLGALKETYSIQEILSLTKGHYGHKTFQDFFCQAA